MTVPQGSIPQGPIVEDRTALEIKPIGNSTGLILPKDLLARLRLKQGDRVIATQGPGGTLTISPYADDMPRRCASLGS